MLERPLSRLTHWIGGLNSCGMRCCRAPPAAALAPRTTTAGPGGARRLTRKKSDRWQERPGKRQLRVCAGAVPKTVVLDDAHPAARRSLLAESRHGWSPQVVRSACALPQLRARNTRRSRDPAQGRLRRRAQPDLAARGKQRADSSRGSGGREPGGQSGRRAGIHARLTNDQVRNHVALVVPFAAGLEPLNAALANASSDAKPSEADSLSPTYAAPRPRDSLLLHRAAGRNVFLPLPRARIERRQLRPSRSYAEMMYRESVRGRARACASHVRRARK